MNVQPISKHLHQIESESLPANILKLEFHFPSDWLKIEYFFTFLAKLQFEEQFYFNIFEFQLWLISWKSGSLSALLFLEKYLATIDIWNQDNSCDNMFTFNMAK
jgi:hypothetical protein